VLGAAAAQQCESMLEQFSQSGKFILMANVLRYWKDYALSRVAAKRQKHLFEDVEAYCMFIGHGRSGHTLHGSLLNAHPEMVLAHELGALSYVKRGIRRDQLYWLLLRRDRWFVHKQKSQWHGYDYKVPNQWQGRFRKLKVIGDRKAGVATLRLREAPSLLQELRRVVEVPIRIIHVVRNPFDIMSSLARQSGQPLNRELIAQHFRMSETCSRLLEECDASEIKTIYHEDFVARPKEQLAGLHKFLGLETDPAHLSDCASVVSASPSKSRRKFHWPEPLISTVHDNIEKYPFLRRYSFSG